jgi:hypothetical protein
MKYNASAMMIPKIASPVMNHTRLLIASDDGASDIFFKIPLGYSLILYLEVTIILRLWTWKSALSSGSEDENNSSEFFEKPGKFSLMVWIHFSENGSRTFSVHQDFLMFVALPLCFPSPCGYRLSRGL